MNNEQLVQAFKQLSYQEQYDRIANIIKKFADSDPDFVEMLHEFEAYTEPLDQDAMVELYSYVLEMGQKHIDQDKAESQTHLTHMQHYLKLLKKEEADDDQNEDPDTLLEGL